MAGALHLSLPTPSVVPPTHPTLLLQRVGDLKSLKQIHAQILKSEFPQSLQVQTKLISLYSLLNQMDFAELGFERITSKVPFTWNMMFRGYAVHGFPGKALVLYSQMLQNGLFPPDEFAFPFILKACGALSAMREGREAHGRAAKIGLASDVYISTALVDFYMKTGDVEVARQLFERIPLKSTVSWNALIAGYSYNELDLEAAGAFRKMQELGFQPNSSTLVSVLPAVARVRNREEGRIIHNLMEDKEIEINESVINSLIAMYGKFGELDIAYQLFEDFIEKTDVAWTAIISAYVQQGEFAKALELFLRMQASGFKPTAVTVASILPACANMMDLKLGMKIHGCSTKSGFNSDLVLSTAFVNMYAKCGCIVEAQRVFDNMPDRNVISWNAMINAFGVHGQGKDALEWFKIMQHNGVQPNSSTLVSVISACSHAGMVEEGLKCFESMNNEYNFVPEIRHYACVVDLFGRAGRLREAHDFIKRMPLEPDDGVWGSLLGACRIHKDMKLGEIAALKALELKPEEPGYYILLTNIYAAEGKWENAQKLRVIMKEKKIVKEAGQSSIDIGGISHSFIMGDFRHSEWRAIYKKMGEMEERLKEKGYVPNRDFSLHEEEIEKDERLAMHSERIALAFGLLKIPNGIPIRITKNLRVCGNCHSAFKLVSRIYGREIVARDLNRFHRFEGGICSCNDYW